MTQFLYEIYSPSHYLTYVGISTSSLSCILCGYNSQYTSYLLNSYRKSYPVVFNLIKHNDCKIRFLSEIKPHIAHWEQRRMLFKMMEEDKTILTKYSDID